MIWRAYVSPEDQHYLEQNHGTERFKQIAGFTLTQVAFHQIKRLIPPELQRSFADGWRSRSRLRRDIDRKITDLLAGLDNRWGEYGQSGTAWVDSKAREMGRFVHSLFN